MPRQAPKAAGMSRSQEAAFLASGSASRRVKAGDGLPDIADRAKRLADRETRIRQTQDAAREFAMALADIRDNELYRESGFKTWTAYLAERWGWTQQRGHQITSYGRALLAGETTAATEKEFRKKKATTTRVVVEPAAAATEKEFRKKKATGPRGPVEPAPPPPPPPAVHEAVQGFRAAAARALKYRERGDVGKTLEFIQTAVAHLRVALKDAKLPGDLTADEIADKLSRMI